MWLYLFGMFVCCFGAITDFRQYQKCKRKKEIYYVIMWITMGIIDTIGFIMERGT